MEAPKPLDSSALDRLDDALKQIKSGKSDCRDQINNAVPSLIAANRRMIALTELLNHFVKRCPRMDNTQIPCNKPADLVVEWSDRTMFVCKDHLFYAKVSASSDGSSDRTDSPRVSPIDHWSGYFDSPFNQSQLIEVLGLE